MRRGRRGIMKEFCSDILLPIRIRSLVAKESTCTLPSVKVGRRLRKQLLTGIADRKMLLQLQLLMIAKLIL